LDEQNEKLLRPILWIKSLDRIGRIAVVVCAVAVTIVIINIWILVAGEGQYIRMLSDKQSAVQLLEKQLEEVKNQPAYATDDVSSFLTKATEAGEAIAGAQTVLVEHSDDASALATMEPYISVSDNFWKGKWILGLGVPYTWRFCTPYDFDGVSEVPMLWQAVSDRGVLCAYATAIYNVDDGKVHDITTKLTSAGSGLTGAEDRSVHEYDD
jgi:hypothetical protein